MCCRDGGPSRRKNLFVWIFPIAGGLLLGTLGLVNVNDPFPENVAHTVLLLVASLYCFSLLFCSLRENDALLAFWSGMNLGSMLTFFFFELLGWGGVCSAQDKCPSFVADHEGQGVASFFVAVVVVMGNAMVARWAGSNVYGHHMQTV